MGSFERTVVRNRLKKIIGGNNINAAWKEYKRIQKEKKDKAKKKEGK